MGNQIAVSGKVILADGSIREFEEAVTAAELMLEYPQHVVVELNKHTSKSTHHPLAADITLEMDKLYLMIPLRRRSGNKALAVAVDDDDEDVVEKPHYLSRQFSWKPNLDTILEKNNNNHHLSITKSPKLALLAAKIAHRIHNKGLLWG